MVIVAFADSIGLAKGKRVIIGSQSPEELAQAIGDMMGQRKRS